MQSEANDFFNSQAAQQGREEAHRPVASKDFRGTITQPTLLLMHILAGKSILTLRSRKTGDRMTLRFARPDDQSNNEYVMGNQRTRGGKSRPVWVSLYGGPEGDYTNDGNERRNWTFLGTIWPTDAAYDVNHGSPFSYRRSAKSKVEDSHPAQRTANWIAQHLPALPDVLMEKAEWWHEGVCGRCGRRLTVPESIETGFGPECRKAVGL